MLQAGFCSSYSCRDTQASSKREVELEWEAPTLEGGGAQSL